VAGVETGPAALIVAAWPGPWPYDPRMLAILLAVLLAALAYFICSLLGLPLVVCVIVFVVVLLAAFSGPRYYGRGPGL
jgi:hypothetical protein